MGSQSSVSHIPGVEHTVLVPRPDVQVRVSPGSDDITANTEMLNRMEVSPKSRDGECVL